MQIDDESNDEKKELDPLEYLEKHHSDGDESGKAAKEDLSATDKASRAAQDELDAEGEEEEDEDEDEGADEDDDEDEEEEEDDALEAAKKSIKRGLGASGKAALKGMTDPEILAFAQSLALQTTKINDQANELDRLKNGQDKSRHEDGRKEGQGAETSARTPASEDAAAALADQDAILDTLDTELFGDDLPDTLKKLNKAQMASMERLLESRLADKLDVVMDGFNSLVDADNRRLLGERFPKLQDPKFAKKVAAKMTELLPGLEVKDPLNVRGNRQKLMEHALLSLDPNAFLKGVKDKPRKGAKASKGTKALARKPAKSSRVKTDTDKKLEFLEARDDGVDFDTAVRQLNS